MKSLTLVITLLFTFAASAQFPGSKPELLLNKELKVLDSNSPKEYGYRDFYKDHELEKVYACCQRYNSKYEKLVNRTFKVTAVEPIKGVKSAGGKYFCLTLQEGKETLYFKYDSEYEMSFPFEVIGGIELPADFYCERVLTRKNEELNYFFISEPSEGIVFYKAKPDNMIINAVGITIPSDTPKPIGKGVSITLENGHVIDYPDNEVEAIDNGLGGSAYRATIGLSDEEVELIKQYKIVKVSVNGIEAKVERGISHRGVFNCMASRGL